MKQAKHWSRTSPDGPWDYIVVGSGMGGMTAAAMLSKLGRRVLLLEQHYVPGGFTHTFPRKGYRWDVGVHAVGEVTEHSMTGRLLSRLTDGRLRWASLGETYDDFEFPGGFRIEFPDNPRLFRDRLVAAFPDEEAAIDAYLDAVRDTANSMRSYYLARALPRWLLPGFGRWMARRAQRRLTQNVGEVLSSLTDDLRLRTVLTAQWGYHGAPPSRASFAMQALVTKHFLWGGYYPVGGSEEIARSLTRTVEEAGGWTRILADVDEILVEKGRAVGVRLRRPEGSGSGEDGEEIRARRVISAVGVNSTVRRLLPAHALGGRAGALEDVRELAPGPAHVCLYLGFKGDIRAAGAGAANRWFYTTWDQEKEVWHVAPGDVSSDAPVLYCSFPSLKDPEHDPGQDLRHTGEVVTFVPWSAFEPWRGTPWKKRGDDYAAFKDELEQSLLGQFLHHMPELRAFVDYVELSTPLSTDHFARPVAGSIYGLEPTPKRFRTGVLRPKAPIKNLYFAGSEVTTVGVMGAMMGGVLAATSAEPARALRYLATV